MCFQEATTKVIMALPDNQQLYRQGLFKALCEKKTLPATGIFFLFHCVLKSLKAHLTKTIVIAASLDQDQAAQNVQPDLRFTLSAMLEYYRQKIARNLQLSLSY